MKFLAFLLLPALLLAETNDTPIWDPWLTDPFFTPTATNIDPGHLLVQPVFAALWQYGSYTNNWGIKREDTIWSINPGIVLQTGFSEKTGIEGFFGFTTNFQSGKQSTHFDDILLFLGYQLLEDDRNSWVPDLRLQLQVNVPTGKYKNFDPDKTDIESTGNGAYQLGPVLAYQKLYAHTHSYFVLHWSLGYIFPFKANVKGFNTYGGGYGTDGTIRPSQTFYAFLSGEYAYAKHWVFAWDSFIFYNTATSSFSGTPGVQANGKPAETGLDYSININLSPQIEYNFSETSGLLFGVWATVAGRNTDALLGLLFTYVHIF